MFLLKTLVIVLGFIYGNTNILHNGDFEATSFAGNWYGSGCNIVKSNDAHTGHHSVHVSNRHQPYQSVAQKVNIISEARYKGTAYVKLLNTTHSKPYQNVGFTLKCIDGHGKNSYKSFGKTSRVSPGDWYEIGGVTRAANGSHNCNIFVATAAFTDFLVDSAQLTRLPYDNEWKTKANQRIEQIRKANIWVNLTGTHSSTVDIELFQTKMEFAVGSAMEARSFSDSTKQKYINTFYNNFEWGVLGNALKWSAMEHRQGHIDYDRSLNAMNAMEAHGIKMRCHCVFWDDEKYVQDWVKTLNHSTLIKAVNKRIHDVISHTKGRCQQWDVLNEMFHWDFYERHTGNPNIGQNMFQQVYAADQKPLLFLNDFGVLSNSDSAVEMKDTAKKYLKAGVPLGGIGVQGHMHDIDIMTMKARLDILAEAGLPIMITEFAVNEKDEHKKATLLTNSLTLFFSHPSVMGVILWGFWDGHIWEPDAYLYTGSNVTANAAGRAYENLFHNTWRTHVTHSLTGNQQYHVRGFKGEYSLKVKHNGQVLKSETFTLKDGGQHLQIHLNSNTGGTPSVSHIIVG